MPPATKAKKPGGPCVALSRDLSDGQKGVCGATESVQWRYNGTGDWAGKPYCGARQCAFAVGARDEAKEKSARADKMAAAKQEKAAAEAAAAAERAAARAARSSQQAQQRPAQRSPPRPAHAAAAAAPAGAQPARQPAATVQPAAAAATQIPACHRSWELLCESERATAATLGFEQWSWDASVLGLDEDIDPRRYPRRRAQELSLAGWIVNEIHEIRGMRLHNPIDMTEQQRECPIPEAELEPCVLVRGMFSSAGGDSDEEVTATRWVHFEEALDLVSLEATPCIGGDTQDKSEAECEAARTKWAAQLKAYLDTAERLFAAAREKAELERQAEAAAAAVDVAAAAPHSPVPAPAAAAARSAAAAPTAAAPTAAAPAAAAARSPPGRKRPAEASGGSAGGSEAAVGSPSGSGRRISPRANRFLHAHPRK